MQHTIAAQRGAGTRGEALEEMLVLCATDRLPATTRASLEKPTKPLPLIERHYRLTPIS
jgi:hypothetical protein